MVAAPLPPGLLVAGHLPANHSRSLDPTYSLSLSLLFWAYLTMVFPSSLRVHAALCALVALPFASATHWIFGGTRPVVTTRLDPIVSPGAVSNFILSTA